MTTAGCASSFWSSVSSDHDSTSDCSDSSLDCAVRFRAANRVRLGRGETGTDASP